MLEFQRFTWNLQRIMRHNRKPILLLFGNGYESQIILMALHKLGKKFTIIHCATGERLTSRTLKVISKFVGKNKLILRPYKKNKAYKIFYAGDNAFCIEDLTFGFSPKDYLIIAGFNLTEPPLMRGFQNGIFDDILCPLMRYCDEHTEKLYQDMKDTERLGAFLHENMDSDSHHPTIKIR